MCENYLKAFLKNRYLKDAIEHAHILTDQIEEEGEYVKANKIRFCLRPGKEGERDSIFDMVYVEGVWLPDSFHDDMRYFPFRSPIETRVEVLIVFKRLICAIMGKNLCPTCYGLGKVLSEKCLGCHGNQYFN